MSLWLDGGFWGPWMRKVFVSEIEWMRRSAFEYVLPSFPDPSIEAEKAENIAWDAILSKPSDGSEDPGDFIDFAAAKGLEAYDGITNARQSAVNLYTVMLWHLLEQQMLIFHTRQVLTKDEEHKIKYEPKVREKLYSLPEFCKRLEQGGCDIKKIEHWSKIDELRLLANAIKHCQGKSLDALYKIRPDFLTQWCTELTGIRKPEWVDKPASGEDIYVQDADLKNYYRAAIEWWIGVSYAVEKHSRK